MADLRRKVLAPIAGLAVFTLPAVVIAPAVMPAEGECAGGFCNVCPVVGRALSTTGAQIYCVA